MDTCVFLKVTGAGWYFTMNAGTLEQRPAIRLLAGSLRLLSLGDIRPWRETVRKRPFSKLRGLALSTLALFTR